MLTGIETEEGWRLSSPDDSELVFFCALFTGNVPPCLAHVGDGWQTTVKEDPSSIGSGWTRYSVGGAASFEAATRSLLMLLRTRPVAMKGFGRKRSLFVSYEAHGKDGLLGRGIVCEYSRK